MKPSFPTLWSWTVNLQKCILLFRQMSLWYFVRTAQEESRWIQSWSQTLGIIKFCKYMFSLRGILSQNDWPETTWETNLITIKPKIESHMAEKSSWIYLPYCSPPGRPFPINSPALSVCVSPHHSFLSVKQKPSSLGSSPPYCNTTVCCWEHCKSNVGTQVPDSNAELWILQLCPN